MTISLKNATSPAAVPHYERLIVESGNFVVPYTGRYLVTAIGGGGSGGCGDGGASLCSGGGAGGMAQKSVLFKKNDVLTIVVGAAGAAVVTGAPRAGNAGGNTTVSGPGLALVANGGGPGNYRSAATVGTASGAVGGTATGGDLNITGGGSGTATALTGGTSQHVLTGGGSVGVYGVGYASGDAATSVVFNVYGGGAGTGGRSANLTNTGSAQINGEGGGPISSATFIGNTGFDYGAIQTRLLLPAGVTENESYGSNRAPRNGAGGQGGTSGGIAAGSSMFTGSGGGGWRGSPFGGGGGGGAINPAGGYPAQAGVVIIELIGAS